MTSIANYHGRCENCSYDLRLSCCQELRHVPLLDIGVNVHSILNPSEVRGKDDLQQRSKYNEVASLDNSDGQECMLVDGVVSSKHCTPSLCQWKINSNGSTLCVQVKYPGLPQVAGWGTIHPVLDKAPPLQAKEEGSST
jgi:[histone H3]-dimethyl-L-lysine9 demethylase